MDKNPSEYSYYRLKMVDLDGATEYSKIEYTSTDCDMNNDINIYPNPVLVNSNQPVSIKFFSKNKTEQLIIVDMMGRMVRRLTLDSEQDWNTLEINVSDLPAGVYQLQIVGSRTSKMLMIQE